MSFEVFMAMAAQNVALWAVTPVVVLADARVPEEHAASCLHDCGVYVEELAWLLGRWSPRPKKGSKKMELDLGY
jgi:hypothetical protein